MTTVGFENSAILALKSVDFSYDFGPLMAGERLLGLIPRSRLEVLTLAGLPLLDDDDAIITASVSGEAELDELLSLVAEHGACCVGVGTMLGNAGWGGFITLSDLNRHPLRSAIYPLFAELEAEVALLVSTQFTDPWGWLGRLDRDKQARIIGYWELSKRDGIDVGPLSATTLSELTRIVGGLEPLRSKLGFASRNKWDEFFGRLIDLRNSIMHPVRPFLASAEEVCAMHEQLQRVLIMLDRLAELRAD